MPAMISSSNLIVEKNFRRLLLSTEKHLDDRSIEDWKVNQVNKLLVVFSSLFFTSLLMY